MAEDEFHLYMNITKASERIYVVYSQLDKDSKKLRPAYLINRIKGIIPLLKAYTEEERRPLEGDGVADYRIIDKPEPAILPLSNDDDSRPTILIVDDDTEIINYMRLLFSNDYRLITCLDADTALEEMRAEEPNIVLSDVAMPGKDYLLLQRLRPRIR